MTAAVMARIDRREFSWPWPGRKGDEVRSTKDDGKAQPGKAGNKKGGTDRQVGDALRAVYQNAVSESVPDEMLDLLNKLG